MGGNGEARDGLISVFHSDAMMTERSTAHLSARERSEQMDALIAQVETLTREHNALVKAVDGLMARTKGLQWDAATETFTLDTCKQRTDGVLRSMVETQRVNSDSLRDVHARLNAIERGTAILSAWVRRPLWERVRGRLGL